ncbi:MAG TPA: UDP-N-acetylglucosamine 2-epimerase (non-hydrolyzing) [Flexilinea sp.]|nr:UDP-N-acetylglucosamine 2-epimerase (non-hydrolyzing) [Flexilinea sp.]HPB39772.1 UDP-N-acetylglucosamine 2-epimerase (non-hydrolyzing) [Flexilinea sp.]
MNNRLKVMVVVGTRPEAIKMAPVIKCLQAESHIETIVCLTAQHREMLDQVLQIFSIPPDIDLNLMTENQTLSDITASILIQMNKVLLERKPDWILVQGDTTTVMAAALAAYYNQMKVGHVEAGLRSWNKWAPFPEEINRKIAGVIADLHFAPTEMARQNLLREGIPPEICHVTGNTVIDAQQLALKIPFEEKGTPLEGIPFGEKEIITVTAHRRENHGKPLVDICNAILKISQVYADRVHIVYPVHLNPIVRKTAFSILDHQPNISLIPPLDYLSMVYLLKNSKILLTDSGGLQEEAPGMGVPVLVLREVTERPEGVISGNVRLVGTDPENIYTHVCDLLDHPDQWEKMSKATNPYGDGKAAERIVKLINAEQK